MKYIISEKAFRGMVDKKSYSEEEVNKFLTQFKNIEFLVPKIVKFFKSKYKERLENIEVSKVTDYFYNVGQNLLYPELKFYFANPEFEIGAEILNDLRDVFGLDLRDNKLPLGIKVYEKDWRRTLWI